MKNIDITDNIPALFGAIETLKQQVAKKEGEAYIEGQGVITGLELAIGLLGLDEPYQLFKDYVDNEHKNNDLLN
ncbi:MAG TPA: hypothetical protein DEV89_01145 [Erysipelotrichaceae bacterium]|nr:hypothetical protein [Erysipelotrichaceae bacterium]